MTPQTPVEGLLDEWRRAAAGQSFDHTMLRGRAFDDLMASVPPAVLAPALLRRVRDEGPWMGYQGLLRRLAGEDLGVWQAAAPRWRAYDVRGSGRLWLAWGVARGHLDDAAERWDDCGHGPEYGRRLCYACRQHEAEHSGGDVGEGRRLFRLTCPACGVLVETRQERDADGEWHVHVRRAWRGETKFVEMEK